MSQASGPAGRRYESLLVIIPAFNEEQSIERVVQGARECAGRLAESGLRLQVCVIDDGSADGTAAAARRAGADHVLVHRRNLGCGAAVRTGLLHGRNQGFGIAVKLDGDGQHDPADIPDLIRPILEDRADVVYGNRFPRITYRMPFVRRVGNALFRALMRWLTHWDVKDSQPGMFAVNDAYLKVSFIPGDYNYTQQVLLDAYLKGMRFEQTPIAFHRREAGESFISLQYPFKVLPQLPDADGPGQAAPDLPAGGGVLRHHRRGGVRRSRWPVVRRLYDQAGREHQPGAGTGHVRPEHRVLRTARGARRPADLLIRRPRTVAFRPQQKDAILPLSLRPGVRSVRDGTGVAVGGHEPAAVIGSRSSTWQSHSTSPAMGSSTTPADWPRPGPRES